MTRGDLIQYNETLVVETCCNCGVAFAMPEDLKRYKLDHRHERANKFFYCPSGHGQFYTGKTEAQKLQEQLDETNQRKEALGREYAKRGRLIESLTPADRTFARRAASYGPAQRSAFWKGVTAMRCGCTENPYKSNRGGYLEAFDAGQAAAIEVEG